MQTDGFRSFRDRLVIVQRWFQAATEFTDLLAGDRALGETALDNAARLNVNWYRD